MHEVIWPPEAVRQLSSIAAYIRTHDPVAAERIVRKLWEAGRSLASFPNRGRLAPQGTRELVTVAPFVIRYDVEGNTVTILSVRHGARRLLD